MAGPTSATVNFRSLTFATAKKSMYEKYVAGKSGELAAIPMMCWKSALNKNTNCFKADSRGFGIRQVNT